MSADNGIYILVTYSDYTIPVDGMSENLRFRNPPERIFVYRVAHIQGIDNLDYLSKNEPYNIGAYLHENWSNSEMYGSIEEARQRAYELEEEIKYTEYGISVIDFSEKYKFYGDG